MRRSWQRAGAAAVYLVTFVALALAAGWPSVRIAPLQPVRVAGQTVEVGAAPPDLSLSGPGELELFGQAMPTEPQFHGPIRPRLKLTQIAADEQVAQLLRSGDLGTVQPAVGRPLASAWLRYGLWETAIAVGLVLLVLTAVTGVRRLPPRRSIAVIAGGVAVTVAVNLAGFYLLASDTPPLAAPRAVAGGLGGTLKSDWQEAAES